MENACDSTVNSSSWTCRYVVGGLYVTHPAVERDLTSSGIPAGDTGMKERRLYLATRSNGEVYAREITGKNSLSKKAALQFIECVDWVNEKKNCWWTYQ